jgi:hypothetical protein
MKSICIVAALLLSSTPVVHAGTTTDPSGHWEGTISAPMGEVRIEVDLAKNAKGDVVGTFSQPAQELEGRLIPKLIGLPLSNVVVKGRAVTIEIKATVEGGAFRGTLLPGGRSMSGDFVSQGGAVPFHLTRTGDARIEAPPKSAPIGKEMEGIWNGAVDVGGKQLRLVLKMSNQRDGTSMGSLASIDQGGTEFPVAIIQKAANLTFEVKVTGGFYVGALNPVSTELVGTYTTQGVVLPLTFRRASATDGKK